MNAQVRSGSLCSVSKFVRIQSFERKQRTTLSFLSSFPKNASVLLLSPSWTRIFPLQGISSQWPDLFSWKQTRTLSAPKARLFPTASFPFPSSQPWTRSKCPRSPIKLLNLVETTQLRRSAELLTGFRDQGSMIVPVDHLEGPPWLMNPADLFATAMVSHENLPTTGPHPDRLVRKILTWLAEVQPFG